MVSEDKKMDDSHRYALEMKKLLDIAERDDLDINLRVEISDALCRLHDLHMKLFTQYMQAARRLGRYE
jgi:hypothetical protein